MLRGKENANELVHASVHASMNDIQTRNLSPTLHCKLKTLVYLNNQSKLFSVLFVFWKL